MAGLPGRTEVLPTASAVGWEQNKKKWNRFNGLPPGRSHPPRPFSYEEKGSSEADKDEAKGIVGQKRFTAWAISSPCGLGTKQENVQPFQRF